MSSVGSAEAAEQSLAAIKNLLVENPDYIERFGVEGGCQSMFYTNYIIYIPINLLTYIYVLIAY